MQVGIIGWAGEEFWPWPEDFAAEARTRGVSKRVPKNGAPDFPRDALLWIVHPKGKITNPQPGSPEMVELVTAVAQAANCNPAVVSYRLPLLGAMARLYRTERKALKSILEGHRVKFAPEIIGYAQFYSIEYVVREGEAEVPDKVLEQFPGATPVQVVPSKAKATKRRKPPAKKGGQP